MRPIPADSLGHAHGLLRAIDKRGRLRTDEFVTEFSLDELFPPDLENALGRMRHFISYARAAGLVKEDRGVVELTEVGKRYIRSGDADAPFAVGEQQAEWLRRQLREKHMTDSIFHGLAIGLSLLASTPPSTRVATIDFGRSMAYLGRAGWDNENTLQIQGERHLLLLQDMEMIDGEHRLTPTGDLVRGELTLPVHMSLPDIAAQLNPGGADAVQAAAEAEFAAPLPDPVVAETPEPEENDDDNGYHTVVGGIETVSKPAEEEEEPRPPIVPRAASSGYTDDDDDDTPELTSGDPLDEPAVVHPPPVERADTPTVVSTPATPSVAPPQPVAESTAPPAVAPGDPLATPQPPVSAPPPVAAPDPSVPPPVAAPVSSAPPVAAPEPAVPVSPAPPEAAAPPVAEAPVSSPPPVAAPPEAAAPPVAEPPVSSPPPVAPEPAAPVSPAPPIAAPEPVAEAPVSSPPPVAAPDPAVPVSPAAPEPVAEAPVSPPPVVAPPEAAAPPVSSAPPVAPPPVAAPPASSAPPVAAPEPAVPVSAAPPVAAPEPAPPVAAPQPPVSVAPPSTPRTTPPPSGVFVEAWSIRAAAEESGLRLADDVYANVAAALNAGKHLVLTGAPGSGKTTLALAVTRAAAQAGHAHGATVVTGAPSQALLIDAAPRGRWVIADELDQAEPDVSLKPLSTLLGGVPVTLNGGDEAEPAQGWRMIATWNGSPPRGASVLRRFAAVDVSRPPADVLKPLLAQQDPQAAEAVETLLALGMPLGAGVLIEAANHIRTRQASVPTDAATLADEAMAAYISPLIEL